MKKLNSKGFVLTRSWIIAICVVAIVAAIAIPTAVYLANKEKPEPTEPTTTAQPQPTEPKPTEPQPTEPQPTEPQPTEPQPTEPQPTEPQPTEPQPTEPQPTEPQPTPHTHHYVLVESNSYAATCENSGLEYYECSCGEVIRRTLSALGHDYTVYVVTEVTHTLTCSRCGAVQGETVAHTISADGTCVCGYTVPEDEKAAYAMASELNAKLTEKNNTLYDTFNALKGEGTIADVIAAIEKAEGTGAAKILWDQTNGKFAVAKEAENVTYALYAAEGGLHDKVENAYLLWDTFDGNNPIVATRVGNGQSFLVDSKYSIYCADENAVKNIEVGTSGLQIDIMVGFDMGEWICKDRIVIFVIGDGDGLVLRTNIAKDAKLTTDSENSKIQLYTTGAVHHYGEMMQVDFDGNRGNTYYEHGTVHAVRFGAAEPLEDATYVFYTEQEGTTFSELNIQPAYERYDGFVNDISKITVKPMP